MTPAPPSDKVRRTGIAVWTLLVIVFAVPALVVAFEGAMHFQGIAIDGPFQLFNALRRIQGGFKPGIDFQFFHGMGVPYAHYWLYRLLGGGLAGSEIARQLIATSMYVIVFIVFFRGFSRDWASALWLTTMALALSWLLKFTVVMFAAVGMIGLRSSLPTLLPVAMYLAPGRRSRTIVVGMLLGAALLMGTEQGIAGVLAYGIVSAVVVLRRRNDRRARLIEAGSSLAIALATMAVFLLAIGGWSGMRGVLHYNFVAVPKDQYWYFGVPPNPIIQDWADVFSQLVNFWPIGLSILLAIPVCVWYLARVWRDRGNVEGQDARRAIALAVLPIYGLISCGSLLGSVQLPYAQPLWRVLLIIGLLEIWRIATAHEAKSGGREWLGVSRALAALALVLSLWTIARVRLIAATLYVAAVHVPRDHIAGRVKFNGAGIWPQTLSDGQAIIDAHRGPNGQLPSLWSLYSGWIEAKNGIFNPSYDYIIQALGKDGRQAYVDTFRSTRPVLVQTMAPTYSGYEPWLENESWEFYDELLKWYDVAGNTPWSLYWARRAAPAADPVLQTTIQVAADAPSVELPTVPGNAPAPVSIEEVEIEYDVHNPLAALPLIGASPRYLIGVTGTYGDTPVSLAPYATRARFLLFVAPGQKPVLNFKTFSLLPGASFAPHIVRVYSRPIDGPNRGWLLLMLQRFVGSR